MSILSSMDLPTIAVDLGPEKIAEDKVKVGSPLMYCDLCDTEVVHKLAQMLLPGLATACVDSTSGSFKTPGSVAVDLRKEMIDYVTQRTEAFVAESVILEGGPDGEESNHPFDIISTFVDDFATSKSNLFARVSGWLLSDRREDNIDDFIQEMEMNNFWTLDRREKIAETFLKNVDFQNKFHCGMKFTFADELANHVYHCNFRTVICENEGCNSRFTAGHLEKHDSTCPFKIIQCEQKCSDRIMRRHMDRHCITICPMKLVNCPFYAVGCRSAIAQCLLEKHRSDDIRSHLWHLLKGMYKEASGEELQRRVEQILQASTISRLAEARDVRSLNIIVKDIEAKLGPLEVSAVKKDSAETVDKNDDREGTDNNTKYSELNTETVDKNDDREGTDNNTKYSELNTETVAKKDDGEDSDKNKGSELNTEIVAKKDDVEDSDNNKSSELSTKAPDMVDSSDKAEVSDIVHMHSSENTPKNKDGEHSHSWENTHKNKDGEQSHAESIGSEDRTLIPNVVSLPDEPEVSIVNKDSAQIHSENKCSAAIEFKIDGGEDSTQTNMTNLSDKVEISATSEDGAENKTTKAHGEDSSSSSSSDNSSGDDKDDEKKKEKRKKKNKGGAEHNVKNKDIEDDNFKDRVQDSELVSDKADLTA